MSNPINIDFPYLYNASLTKAQNMKNRFIVRIIQKGIAAIVKEPEGHSCILTTGKHQENCQIRLQRKDHQWVTKLIF